MDAKESTKPCTVLAGPFQNASTFQTTRPFDTIFAALHSSSAHWGPMVTTDNPFVTWSSSITPRLKKSFLSPSSTWRIGNLFETETEYWS
jgi:hypothetical protein